MDDKTRLDFIKLNVIKPKKNGQVRNLYNKDFEWLLVQAEKVERLEKDKEILIKEIERHFNETYKQPKVVAELLKTRAFIFTCSYKTAWDEYLDDNEKFNFTYEEILEYIDLTKAKGLIKTISEIGKYDFWNCKEKE